MHGGQETTLTSMMLPLFHHGMMVLGLPYTLAPLSTTQSGGTPYGATHVSGSNHDVPLSEDEMMLARSLGERVAQVAKMVFQHAKGV
jgi:NAD(P)H dehydrogenase (quinone)